MSPTRHGRPERLERIFSTHAFPVFFVTACTANRAPLLANEIAHRALISYARKNVAAGRAMGRYVLMPDHLHFLVRLHPEAQLSAYVRLLRQAITVDLRKAGLVADGEPAWQPGFFDHLLRSVERTSQAWQYLVDNPVCAGLVPVPEDWPYQGEIESIRF
jgi:putative transposase